MIIYKVTNKVNDKYYIGLTTSTLEKRKIEHISNSKNPDMYFTRALQKYGPENFDWEIIDTADDIEMLQIKEMFWIWHWKSHSPLGYNLTDGGEGTFGYIHTEEAKEKNRKAHLGYKHTEEWKRNRRNKMKLEKNPFYGKNHTEESKEKMRLANLGKEPWNKGLTKETNEIIKYQSENMIGKKNKLGYKFTQEEKERIYGNRHLSTKGKPWSKARRDAQIKKNLNIEVK